MQKALVLVGMLTCLDAGTATLAVEATDSPVPQAKPSALVSAEDPGRLAVALYQLAARGEASDGTITSLCLHDDPYVRRAAVFALGTTGDAAHKALFARAARDADPGVRRAAVFALTNLGGADVVPLLETALSDSHPSVRELAATAMGRLGGELARQRLVATLNDPSVRVRRAAVVALGDLGDSTVLDALRRLRDAPQRGIDTRRAALTRQQLAGGHNFGYEFLTLPALMTRFSRETGIPTFVTDEALMAVALAAEELQNLDSLKVSMWHVKASTFLDELTHAAGLAWLVEGRWVIVTLPAYLAYDTPLELEIAGALHRLGDPSGRAVLRRYAKQRRWKARAEALLGKD